MKVKNLKNIKNQYIKIGLKKDVMILNFKVIFLLSKPK